MTWLAPALAALAVTIAAPPPGEAATSTPTPTSTPSPTLTVAPAPTWPPLAHEEEAAIPPPPLVERVVFVGLHAVREWAARRHLLVTEGARLDQDRVVLSRLRLLQLGWFWRVETRLERGSGRGRVVLVFEVEERNTLVISDLVLGSTGPQPIYGGLGLSQQNFLGQGLGLTGAFAYGGAPSGRPDDPARFAARAAFSAPDVSVSGLRLLATASALWLRGEELTCADRSCDSFRGRFGDAPRLRYQRAGGEAAVGVRPGPFERIYLGVRWERLDATPLPGSVGPVGAVPAILMGRSNLAALSATWEYDSRDDLFFPTEGLHGLAQVTFGSKVLGSDYEYSRYVLQAETGFGLLGRPLRLLLLVGAAQGGAPFFERFYPADLAYFTVGPALSRALELNFSPDSHYDAFAAVVGLEYGVPLWQRGRFFHRGYLAIGARGVWTAAEPGAGRDRFSRWPVSFDVALRVDTPVGTFNASLGAALDNLL